MKLNNVDNLRAGKRPQLQLTLRNILPKSGPKYVEAVGVQPAWRYCGRKFHVPRGLACHIQMHERHGDLFMLRKPNERASDTSFPSPPRWVKEALKGIKEKLKVPVVVDTVVDNEEPAMRT